MGRLAVAHGVCEALKDVFEFKCFSQNIHLPDLHLVDCVSGPGYGFGNSERAAFFDGIALLRSLKVLSLIKGEAYVGGDAAVARVLRGMPCLEKVHVGDLTSEKPFADLAKLKGKASTGTAVAAAK